MRFEEERRGEDLDTRTSTRSSQDVNHHNLIRVKRGRGGGIGRTQGSIALFLLLVQVQLLLSFVDETHL